MRYRSKLYHSGYFSISPTYHGINLNSPRATRGCVETFSLASRRRMIKLINSIDFDSISCGSFVTLTFGKRQFDIQHVQHCLRLYLKHFAYPVLWRIEKHKSGAYHVHLVVFSAKLKHGFVFEKWRKYSQCCARGVKVVTLNYSSIKATLLYVAKYIAKIQSVQSPGQDRAPARGPAPDFEQLGLGSYLPKDRNTGRFWGLINRNKLIIHAVICAYFDADFDFKSFLLTGNLDDFGFVGLPHSDFGKHIQSLYISMSYMLSNQEIA